MDTPGGSETPGGETPGGTPDEESESGNAITDLLHGKTCEYRVFRDLKSG